MCMLCVYIYLINFFNIGKKKLKDNYCIILSQSFEGTNRFNGYCIGDKCNERTYQLNYFTKKFKYDKNKKESNE